MITTLVLAVWIIGALVLGVASKCGLSEWAFQRNDDEWGGVLIVFCEPMTWAVWPILIIIIPASLFGFVFLKTCGFIARHISSRAKQEYALNKKRKSLS